ncbi:MAG: cyclic nucleotide-binding domain-containing protein [Hyphomicrobium sp.]
MSRRDEMHWLTGHDLPRRTFDAGETVFLEHQAGDAMFVVVAGCIDVLSYGRVLEKVGPGGIFGEMALIDDEPRSAAALATEPSVVVVISRVRFMDLVTVEPAFALHVMRVLAARLRRR